MLSKKEILMLDCKIKTLQYCFQIEIGQSVKKIWRV